MWVGHEGLGWVMQGGVGHVGLGWDGPYRVGWGRSCRGWGGSCRGRVGWVM